MDSHRFICITLSLVMDAQLVAAYTCLEMMLAPSAELVLESAVVHIERVLPATLIYIHISQSSHAVVDTTMNVNTANIVLLS